MMKHQRIPGRNCRLFWSCTISITRWWPRTTVKHHPERSRCSTLFIFAMNAVPRKAEVLALFRHMIRHSSKIVNYNFRSHAKRRIRAGFEQYRSVAGEELAEKYKYGLTQLDVVKRQSVISQLYPDTVASVMQKQMN
jgi:hypothetical protein